MDKSVKTFYTFHCHTFYVIVSLHLFRYVFTYDVRRFELEHCEKRDMLLMKVRKEDGECIRKENFADPSGHGTEFVVAMTNTKILVITLSQISMSYLVMSEKLAFRVFRLGKTLVSTR